MEETQTKKPKENRYTQQTETKRKEESRPKSFKTK